MSSSNKSLHRPDLPLVVDLDGCLLRSDLLVESALAFVRPNPFRIFSLLTWLVRGRSFLKAQLAQAAQVDIDLLPANAAFVEFLASEKTAGRRLFLATASDRVWAARVAERFGFFDDVFASDGETNLKGPRKAERLAQEFPDGYAYAGDSSADLILWKDAVEAIVVGASSRVERRARRIGRVVQVFPKPSQTRALLRAARPHQWTKNSLIFVPLILSGQLSDSLATQRTFWAFIALSLVASANYIVNDLWDLPDDRNHWTKRERPLASGTLGFTAAASFVVLAPLIGFGIATWIGQEIVSLIALYLAITLTYSFRLKRVPLLDSFILASLYTLRLVIGIAASRAEPSEWLLVFSMFIFTSLGLAKRYTEIQRAAAAGQEIGGRGYEVGDGPLVLAAGVSSGLGAVLIMILYLINDAFVQSFYGQVGWLWGFPIVLQLFVCRLWLVCHRGDLDDDPLLFTLKDPTSLSLVAVAAVCFFAAWLL